MYLLFKNVDAKQLGSGINVIGTWNNYAIGFVPDTHIDSLEYRHLNAKVIDEVVAWTWMFFGAFKCSISVRTGTKQNERLQLLSSHEATGEKTKYFLTEEDKSNTTLLMKEIMRMMLDDIFDKRLVQLNVSTSALEAQTWSQQKTEAAAFLTGETNLPLLQSLANARGITLEEMAGKVNYAIEKYNAQLGVLLSNKQAIEAEIKACESIADCNRLLHNRFEIEMPVIQREEEQISYSAKFDI